MTQAKHEADNRVVFRLELPQGHCVGVTIEPDPADRDPAPASAVPSPPAEELAFAAALGPVRRASFSAGRLALRLALADLGLATAAAGALLPDARGAPQLPPGTMGSISHKQTLAVALAAARIAPGQPGAGPDLELGVDLEQIRPLRINIARKVLTPGELDQLAQQPADAADRFVLERFSLKEAFFKAANGLLGPRISFQEVEIAHVAGDGSGLVQLRAPALDQRGFHAQGWLGCPRSGWILSAVGLRR